MVIVVKIILVINLAMRWTRSESRTKGVEEGEIFIKTDVKENKVCLLLKKLK